MYGLNHYEGMSDQLEAIKASIRDVKDFPKPGIIFKDITPVLSDGALFQTCISLMVERVRASGASKVAGLDARGFIFGAAVADRLGMGFIPIRKKGKLPYKTESISYDLEYGGNTLEMHVDAVQKGERVVIIDDLLATGGTAAAAKTLLERGGANLVGMYFLIELSFLNGRKNLEGLQIDSLITY